MSKRNRVLARRHELILIFVSRLGAEFGEAEAVESFWVGEQGGITIDAEAGEGDACPFRDLETV